MSASLFERRAYAYDLPKELIAQDLCTPRDRSRLMVLDREKKAIAEYSFRDIESFLGSGDSLVLNDTKVIPARLSGKRASGGEAEIFLVRAQTDDTWLALVRPARKLREGAEVYFGDDCIATILEKQMAGMRLVRFAPAGDFPKLLQRYGQTPLPPYILRETPRKQDMHDYQTVYAAHPGAVAAPTAGLHFTQELLQRLQKKGVWQTHITLHVGLGTFRPVQVEDIRQHPMHKELFIISEQAADALNNRPCGKRQICVGTTSCRALEAAAKTGVISPGAYETDIFLYPGYSFRYVQHLLTNFHLPGSTLLMLVCAFAGYDFAMQAYRLAVQKRYRFFSYGDAMLIL